MTQRLVLIMLMALLSCGKSPAGGDRLDFSKCHALITGVLSWQDRSLSPFDARMRKDRELHSLLISRGVRKEQTVLLMDREATLGKMRSSLTGLLSTAGKDSVFLFYYAGHGIKAEKNVYFANYDIKSGNPGPTGFGIHELGELILKHFKGSRVILMADCCHSGSLGDLVDRLSAKGIQAFSLTSSESSNISTENWTFTQTVIDCISGNALADRDLDGSVTLDEMHQEVKDAMKYREMQKSSFRNSRVPGSLVIAKNTNVKKPAPSQPPVGSYVLGYFNEGWKPCRILEGGTGQVTAEFFFYCEKKRASLTPSQIKPFHMVRYDEGKTVQVIWNSKPYQARILRLEDDFHFITYPGFSSEWDEWVLYDRIVPDGPVVTVEWKGKPAAAKILGRDGGRVFVRYVNYDHTWDEWVDAGRVRSGR